MPRDVVSVNSSIFARVPGPADLDEIEADFLKRLHGAKPDRGAALHAAIDIGHVDQGECALTFTADLAPDGIRSVVFEGLPAMDGSFTIEAVATVSNSNQR